MIRWSRVTGGATPAERVSSQPHLPMSRPTYSRHMGVLEQLAVVIGFFAVLLVATVAISRDKPRSGGPMGAGNPFGPVEEIFHPAAHRAGESLKEQDEVAETVPSPDGDDPANTSPLRLLRGPSGELRAVRLPRR